MRKALVTLVLTLGLMFGMLSTTATAANAGTVCNLTYETICGEISVRDVSKQSIQVTYSWGDILATDRWIVPGRTSASYGVDTDGFKVQSGTDIICYTHPSYPKRFTATGWYKIRDIDDQTCWVVLT